MLMCLLLGHLLLMNMLCKHQTQGSCNVSAGGSDSLDEDVIDILPRLLSSSPLRMLCLQHTGTPPLSLPSCSLLPHAEEWLTHSLSRDEPCLTS